LAALLQSADGQIVEANVLKEISVTYSFLSLAAAAAVAAPAPLDASVAPQLLGAAQAAAAAPAQPPTRAELLRTATASFSQVDTNKDGSLSKAEIDAAQLRNQQRATTAITQRINQEFTKLDTDRNGQLSPAEFRAAAPAVRSNPGAGAAVMARLDKNKDGKITTEEYRTPILAGFDRIDTNKDGTISADERSRASRSPAK
jgi:Ca2+-binding EF-hand superfamily protein